MCEEKSGHSSAIQCPYHAWTYGLDGRLVGAPHMDKVEGFDKAEHSLHAVNLALWEGFIFVNLADEPTPLDESFAPLAGKFTHWNLPKLRSAKRIDYDVRANWKLIFENYSECYHCPGVHPDALEIDALRFGGERSVRRALPRRFHADHKGPQPDHERQCLRAAGGRHQGRGS